MSERNVFSGIVGRKRGRNRSNKRRNPRQSDKGRNKTAAREMREAVNS